jgi:hypothetical protein
MNEAFLKTPATAHLVHVFQLFICFYGIFFPAPREDEVEMAAELLVRARYEYDCDTSPAPYDF